MTDKTHLRFFFFFVVFLFSRCVAHSFEIPVDSTTKKEIVAIDLRELDLTSDKLYPLKGKWKFYRHALLFPEETKDRDYELITVPSAWNSMADMPVFGYATYQVDLYLPQKHHQLSIYFPFIATASKIWLNDALVSEKGIVGYDPQDHRGALGPVIINIPDGLQKMTLTIQVSNYSYPVAGILGKLEIGQGSLFHQKLNIEKAWYNLFAGSLLAISIIHLMLFGLYRNKAYLFLALICICVSLRTFVLNKGSMFIPDMMPFIEMEFLKKLEYFVVYLLLILFPWYVYTSFKGQCPTIVVKVFSAIGVLFSGAAIFSPVMFYTAILDAAHFIFLLEFIFAGYVLFINRSRSDTKIILLGILSSFPFILLEMLANSGIISYSFNHMVELGVLIFFFFQALLLAKKNAKAFRMAENLNITLELQVKERTNELSNLNQMKDSLLSIISHDLKSPINSLKGVLHLYNNGYITEAELQPMMARMEKDVNNTWMLLDNILTWSASQKDSIRINFTKLNMHAIMEEHLQIFHQQAKLKNIKLVNAVKPDLYVKADENVIKLVLRNLISNAIKFTPNDGVVEVVTIEKGGKVNLMVRDNGVGMDQETLQKIFHEFISSSRGTEDEKGHGLGLSLCKKFLTKMGAQIQVRSMPMHGTTFSISLEPYKEPAYVSNHSVA